MTTKASISESVALPETPAVYEPRFNDVMIDIETMSLHPHRALILSVGMLEFDPRDEAKLHTGKEMLLIPEILPQIMLGRRVDVGTQEFWAKQSPEAQAHFMGGSHNTLPQVVAAIRTFCTDKTVWANGTQFDLSNLKGLAEDFGDTKDLWHYQAPRDMRTFTRTTQIRSLVPIGDALHIPGIAHDPIYDCHSQAWRVWSNWGF